MSVHPSSNARLTLPEDEVHVWCAGLDLNAALLEHLERALTPEERSRAARYFFARDRNQFIAARSILRDLLGKYIGLSADTLELRYGAHGKPYCEPINGAPPVHFNLSHSAGTAVFAFTSGREVGVDVEAIRADFVQDEIAIAHFSKRELAEFRSLSPSLRAEGFFLCWTRKEAYLKALGWGLQVPLTSFSVSLTPGQPEDLQSCDSDRWQMTSFRPAPGHVASVIAEGKNWHLREYRWQFSG